MSSRILPYYEQLEKVKSSERPEVWDETMEPPCDIVTTFHGTLFNTARNKFLLDPCGGEKEDGCKAIDLMACSDLSTLFFSWRTFWNCLTLAGVAMELYDDSESPLDETTSRIQVGRGGQHQLEFNTSWLDGFNLMQIFNLTFACAQASCEQWSLDGNCSIAYPDFSTTNVSLMEEMVGTLKNVCDDLPTLNLDIAGPGVIISYTIQATFVVVAVIAFRLLGMESMINFFMAPWEDIKRTLTDAAGPRRTFTEGHPRLRSFFGRVEDNVFVHSTMALLFDFQEAQCCFLLSLQIAALIATSQRAEFQGTFTVFSLLENNRATKQLSHFGLMAITLIQIVLHRLGIDSAYTVLISVATFGLSALAREMAFDVGRMGATIASAKTLMPVGECGRLGTLRIQCTGQATRLDGMAGETALVWERLGYLLALCVLCFSTIQRGLSRQHYFRFLKRWIPRRFTGRGSRKGLLIIVTATLGLLEAYLTISLMTNWSFLFDYMKALQNKSDSENALGKPAWNIGQVLAVLIWIPVLLKYLYTLTRGIEESFRTRVSTGYVVRKREESARRLGLSAPLPTMNLSGPGAYDQEMAFPQLSSSNSAASANASDQANDPT